MLKLYDGDNGENTTRVIGIGHIAICKVQLET